MHEHHDSSARSRIGIGPEAALRMQIQHPHVCSTETRMAVLGRVRLFRDLDAEGIAQVDAMMIARSAPTDAMLCHAGDPADALHVLAVGRAKSYTTTVDGHEVIDTLLAPGDVFGGLAALGQRQQPTSVRTLTDVCVLRIDAPAFRQLLLRLPSVSLRVIDELSEQLDAARGTTAMLASSPVMVRVAATLDSLCSKFGTPSSSHPGAIDLHLPLSRADLAGLTGSRVESVSRAMSTLRREGTVKSGRQWTTVLDRERLKALADGIECCSTTWADRPRP